MTELQVLAMRQMAINLAAFQRDHVLIMQGGIRLDADDKYDYLGVDHAIRDMEANMRYLCQQGGREDL